MVGRRGNEQRVQRPIFVRAGIFSYRDSVGRLGYGMNVSDDVGVDRVLSTGLVSQKF